MVVLSIHSSSPFHSLHSLLLSPGPVKFIFFKYPYNNLSHLVHGFITLPLNLCNSLPIILFALTSYHSSKHISEKKVSSYTVDQEIFLNFKSNYITISIKLSLGPYISKAEVEIPLYSIHNSLWLTQVYLLSLHDLLYFSTTYMIQLLEFSYCTIAFNFHPSTRLQSLEIETMSYICVLTPRNPL